MDTSTFLTDSQQLMDLLWRRQRAQPVRPGPRARISVDDIVNAGIDWADARGLESLTVRDLARELGVKPMTLYSHVPQKSTLIVLMIDAAMETYQLADESEMDWHDRVLSLADANLRLFLAHPWLLRVWSAQSPLGPGVIRKYERELRMLVPLGLEDVETDAVLTHIIGMVRGAAADMLSHRNLSAQNDEWWALVSPILAEYVTAGEYPLATRIGIAAGTETGSAYNPEYAWEFALDRLIDGLEMLVEKGGAGRGSSSA